MQAIKHSLANLCRYDFSRKYPLEKLLFFDIETTGLSADISSLYLIGCIYYERDTWNLIQWFADEYHEEQALLDAFFSFASNFSVLLHYNGNGFDIPYLEKKCRQYHLNYSFSNLESLDLYKHFLPFKKLLTLSSIKQKKVEELFGLHRKDQYSGGELIKVYGDYLHGKIFREGAALLEERKNTLLLHNREDLTGLLYIAPVLSFEDLTLLEPEITSCVCHEKYLALEATLPSPLPIAFSMEDFSIGDRPSEKERFLFQGHGTTGTMEIPLSNGQFKLYYENYTDYFYLPAEDTAVHKSVAAFVDKEYRQKATKATCYTKITVTDDLLQDKKQLAQCFQRLLTHYINLNSNLKTCGRRK